jgi:hypothetical protein
VGFEKRTPTLRALPLRLESRPPAASPHGDAVACNPALVCTRSVQRSDRARDSPRSQTHPPRADHRAPGDAARRAFGCIKEETPDRHQSSGGPRTASRRRPAAHDCARGAASTARSGFLHRIGTRMGRHHSRRGRGASRTIAAAWPVDWISRMACRSSVCRARVPRTFVSSWAHVARKTGGAVRANRSVLVLLAAAAAIEGRHSAGAPRTISRGVRVAISPPFVDARRTRTAAHEADSRVPGQGARIALSLAHVATRASLLSR